MSSDAVAQTLPPLHISAHCASASDGASTTGTPISRNNFLVSSVCSRVTVTLSSGAA
jgi:hypothetical protein